MTLTPDVMPVLSRGRHRNPRRGACFMEMASYLAGERWSDHPACTHPLLAGLARQVNDHLDDDARSRIAVLIPDVVGVRDEDPRSYAWIAGEAAMAALPVASASRQRTAAVGLLRCQHLLNRIEGRPIEHLDVAARVALDTAPQARDWAVEFSTMGASSDRAFMRRGAPAVVYYAVSGIAEACVPDTDERLVALLERAITVCRERFPSQPGVVRPASLPVHEVTSR